MNSRSRDIVGLAGALVVALACVRLGVWQLARLGDRRARNAAVRAARMRPPLVVTGALGGDSVTNRRLWAQGRYDYEYERFWRPRAYSGVPGVEFITPLRLADGSAVLVDRGWAPSADAYHVDEQRYRGPDSAEVEGIAVPVPRAPGDVDPAKLRDSLPYPLLPFTLQALSADRLGGVPSSAGTPHPPAAPGQPDAVGLPGAQLERSPLPELSDGPHLSYAIQWFSFAVIIAVGSIALLRQRWRGGAA